MALLKAEYFKGLSTTFFP